MTNSPKHPWSPSPRLGDATAIAGWNRSDGSRVWPQRNTVGDVSRRPLLILSCRHCDANRATREPERWGWVVEVPKGARDYQRVMGVCPECKR